jgi:hypothetical protein
MVLEFLDHHALPDLPDLSPICGAMASDAVPTLGARRFR